MYPGLKNELTRIITNPKFKLKYSSRVVDDRLYETYTLHNGNVQIVEFTKETITHYINYINPETGATNRVPESSTYKYSFILNQKNDATPNVDNLDDFKDLYELLDDIKELYELCEKRQKFYNNPVNVAAMDFLTRQR